MAHLSKLAIRGIRSFDDKQISVIEFFSPVTVIVGHNGSGKTTIIECLKYATTGDQPPNTRGGAFVHDPKMANEKEVKAQVKLRFHAANGTRMLAVRNLSVTMKKTGALTMKTLESILGLDVEKGGKRGTISTKCAELDAEIPSLLGVSKAVLENVIFCHQEDSYWPLAEPSTLKKKFDDIFEATKYTKALDAIKTLRKERVAELKTDKERLEGLSREKGHADKLRARVAELAATIAAKKVEYEETVAAHDQLAIANAKLWDYSHKFRVIFNRVEDLEKQRTRYRDDLADAKENTEEIEGTQQELEERVKNFEQHRQQQNDRRRQEENRRLDLEEEIHNLRGVQEALIEEIGQLSAEEKNQEERILHREGLIREISTRQNIRGYEHSPLERDKVLEFISRLMDLQEKQSRHTEDLQTEKKQKDQEYEAKRNKLTTTLEGFKAQRQSLRTQISTLQASISNAETKIDESQTLPAELRTIQTDITDKRARLEVLRGEARAARFDERLAERVAQARTLEAKRDALNGEIRALSLQADTRARLDLKRAEVRNKRAEVENTLQINNPKFRKMVGSDARAETMEREIERVSVEKDREHADLEAQASAVNKNLQQAETTLSHLKSDLRAKQQELRKSEQRVKEETSDYDSLAEGIAAAQEEVSFRKNQIGEGAGASKVYAQLLKLGQQKKTCTACNRHLDDAELEVFERYLREKIKATDPEKVKDTKVEIEEWSDELKRLQSLQPVEALCARLRTELIPALEKQIKETQTDIPGLSQKAEVATSKLDEIKRELKDLNSMKQHAAMMTKTLKDIDRASQDVKTIESDLATTGSTKTADDVQIELDSISNELRVNEREKENVVRERDRQGQVSRTHELELHSMELRESDLRSQIREREHLEERVETYRKDIAAASSQSKELDEKIVSAQGPLDRLMAESHQVRSELEARIKEAMNVCQQVNIDVDKLDALNRSIEKFVRDKRGKKLRDSQNKSEDLKAEIAELNHQLESARLAVAAIDKEINEGGATLANLRGNIRIRKLAADIAATQQEIDSHDVEAAAKAKRTFDERYGEEKEKETQMASKYARIDGELGTHQAQLEGLEHDLYEFKNVQAKYTEQLIKVKMADMANNDLEKYAKALDNAIMKYHSLKMEEVNDNMRHLWNKTYQGTDIDGIKIRYDSEGGATKRSYNYRVVMTKDQVEMDMRGRCSAGQKMLASIIIRLALSDSFGQNCGILALDEPTNALDVENIDALAASLIDIINERKNHSNFQLIIITHDENFLRKLGQSEVMEYYWRVSRDARQKSVIERQRFR